LFVDSDEDEDEDEADPPGTEGTDANSNKKGDRSSHLPRSGSAHRWLTEWDEGSAWSPWVSLDDPLRAIELDATWTDVSLVSTEEEVSLQRCELTVHPCELTAHRCELIMHGCELTAHRCELTVHGCELTAHRCELIMHGCELTAHGCELIVHGCELTVDGCELTVIGCETQIYASDTPEWTMRAVTEPTTAASVNSSGQRSTQVNQVNYK
jgi:hypothetical protein